MKNWQEIEKFVYEKVSILLGPNYTIEHTGGHNSNALDIYILDKQRQMFKNIEVKKLPSIAGVQVVIKLNDKGNFVYNKSEQAPELFAELLISLANKYKDQQNIPISLSGDDATEAFAIFETKYKKKNTGLIIGVADGLLFASFATAEEMQNYYIPVLTIRIKQSGSRPAPKFQHALIRKKLEDIPLEVSPKGRLILPDSSLTPLANAKILNDTDLDGIWISPNGEIKKSGTTRNLNAMLSLKLNPDSVSKNVSDERLRQLLTKDNFVPLKQ